MAVKIGTLRCRVIVRTRTGQDIEHRSPAPEMPSLTFAMPFGELSGQASRPPSETATGDRPSSGPDSKPIASPSTAGPSRVAERVYDIMKDEVRLEKLRRGRN